MAPSEAQIKRWIHDYTAAANSDGESFTDVPTLRQARRVMQRFARKVLRLEAALADAFAPGAAHIIAEADLAWEDELNGIEEVGWGSIQFLGEALAWGLAGADPAVLDRLRAETAARKAVRQ